MNPGNLTDSQNWWMTGTVKSPSPLRPAAFYFRIGKTSFLKVSWTEVHSIQAQFKYCWISLCLSGIQISKVSSDFFWEIKKNVLTQLKSSNRPVCVCVSRSILCNSLQPHGLSPTRLLCPWDSLSKNTRVGCHSFLQGIFLTQGLNLGLPHCRQNLYCLSH